MVKGVGRYKLPAVWRAGRGQDASTATTGSSITCCIQMLLIGFTPDTLNTRKKKLVTVG